VMYGDVLIVRVDLGDFSQKPCALVTLDSF
jgi:hypothetical protein